MAQFVRCNFRGQGHIGPCRTQRGGRLAAAAEQAVHVDRGATADLQVAEVEVVRLAAHGPLVEEQRDVLAAAQYEAVHSNGVYVISHDLPAVIDLPYPGAAVRDREIDDDEFPGRQHEPVAATFDAEAGPRNLSLLIDPER